MRRRSQQTPARPFAPLVPWRTPDPGRFDSWGETDRGRRRSNNEDAFAVQAIPGLPDSLLLVVADGLGGASGGEVASRSAVDAVVDELSSRPPAGDETPSRALRRAVERARQAIKSAARDKPDLRDLGTTLTVALVLASEVWVAHVGDSRAYLFRRGRLQRLTRDHTMAERLREEGVLGPHDRAPTWESVLWNALGAGDRPMVEEHRYPLQPGDALLLCSDGLTRHLDDAQLAQRLSRRSASRELCEELVAAANRAGGEDNVTVVLGRTGSKRRH